MMGDAAPVSRWAQRRQQREQMYATSSDAIQVSLDVAGASSHWYEGGLAVIYVQKYCTVSTVVCSLPHFAQEGLRKLQLI